jgi:hypothetical protein
MLLRATEIPLTIFAGSGVPRDLPKKPAGPENASFVERNQRSPRRFSLERSAGQESEPSFPTSPFFLKEVIEHGYLGQKPRKREAQFCLFFNYYGWHGYKIGQNAEFLDRMRIPAARSRCICIMAWILILERGKLEFPGF